MKSKYTILAAALAASLFGVPAWAASTATSSSNAAGTGTANANNAGIGNSNSGSYSGASSGSTATGGTSNGYAGSVVNFTYSDPPAPSDPTETIQGTQRLITTGTAIAPSIYSNNVCGLSAAAAGGFLGGAFSIGFDRIDKGCDRRAFAALLGHFAEINSIAAAHAPDPQVRALAEHNAEVYSQWANNYLCMQDEDLAAAAPPGSNVCRTVATQTGLQVVPAPVASEMRPKQVAVAAPTPIADPPAPKPVYTGPHDYGPHEGAVPSSWHTGPISGYQGPDYTDD